MDYIWYCNDLFNFHDVGNHTYQMSFVYEESIYLTQYNVLDTRN
jgi:hypothetical protein